MVPHKLRTCHLSTSQQAQLLILSLGILIQEPILHADHGGIINIYALGQRVQSS